MDGMILTPNVGEKIILVVDDSDIKIITIPVGYTHNIENIGEGEMILVMWCNELFDEDKPDTYRKDIK